MSDDNNITIPIDGDTYARLAKAADEHGVGVDELAEAALQGDGEWVCDDCGDPLATEDSSCSCDDWYDVPRQYRVASDGLRACAEWDEVVEALQRLLAAFPDLGRGYSTHEQQCALRQARRVSGGGR